MASLFVLLLLFANSAVCDSNMGPFGLGSALRLTYCASACASGGTAHPSSSVTDCKCALLPPHYRGMKPVENGPLSWKQQPRLKNRRSSDSTHAWNTKTEFLTVSPGELKGWLKHGFPEHFEEGTYGYVVSEYDANKMSVFRLDQSATVPKCWWLAALMEPPGHTSVFSRQQFKEMRAGEKKAIFAGRFRLDANRKMETKDGWDNCSGHFRPSSKQVKLFANVWGFNVKHFRAADFGHSSASALSFVNTVDNENEEFSLMVIKTYRLLKELRVTRKRMERRA